MAQLDALDLLLKAVPPFAKKKPPGDEGEDDEDGDGIPDNEDSDNSGDSDTAPGGDMPREGEQEPDGDEDGAGPGDDDGDELDDAEGDGEPADGDAEDADADGLEGADGDAEDAVPSDDPQSLIQQIADAERDYYAAKGFHGAHHHNAMALLDTYHKLVRKLVRAVQSGQSGPGEDDQDGDGIPDGEDVDADGDGQKDTGEEASRAQPQFGGKPKPKKPPQFGKSSLFKAAKDSEIAGHKYLTRKPDGKGGWRYVYLPPEGHETTYENNLQDALKQAQQNNYSGHFFMRHEGKPFSAKVKTSGSDLVVTGRPLHISDHEMDYASKQHGVKASDQNSRVKRHGSYEPTGVGSGPEQELFRLPKASGKKAKALGKAFFHETRSNVLRKGLDGFADDGTDVVIPDRFLMPYLVSFIETSYGVVSQESPQQMYDEQAMAAGVMQHLVQSLGSSRNLRLAARRYKITQDAVAQILRDRQIITVTASLAAKSTLPTDEDSHAATGSAGIDGAVFQLSQGNDWYKALDADQHAHSSSTRLSYALSPNKQTRFEDDRHVPRFGAAANVALDYSERDRFAKASIAADCVVHGYKAVQQTDMLTHAFGACSCPHG